MTILLVLQSLVYTDDLFWFSVYGEGKRNQLLLYKYIVYCSVQLGDTVQTSVTTTPVPEHTEKG